MQPISVTSAFNTTGITNPVSPSAVLRLWKKQALFPSTHTGNHWDVKYAPGDGQGGMGGECNNAESNTGRANETQFAPQKKRAEQSLSLPCMAPLSKPVYRRAVKRGRFHQHQKQSLHD